MSIKIDIDNYGEIEPGNKDGDLIMVSQEDLNNLLEVTNEIAKALIDMLEDRCFTCRIFNPQHKYCLACNDVLPWRKLITKADPQHRSWEKIKEIKS